jgi:hypothetical protein
VVSFTLRSLYPRGKSSRYPLDRRLSGFQSRSGRCGVEENLFCPRRKSNPGCPAHCPSLYRLRCRAPKETYYFYEPRILIILFCKSHRWYPILNQMNILHSLICSALRSAINANLPNTFSLPSCDSSQDFQPQFCMNALCLISADEASPWS